MGHERGRRRRRRGQRHRDGPPRQQLRDRLLSGTATFGAGEANETVLSGCGRRHDVFVAKYARDGTLLWATSAGGAERRRGASASRRTPRQQLRDRLFLGTATFGAGEANETVLSSAGSADMFVAKYAPDGTLLWATSAGGASVDEGIGIATDPRGNSYVTGVSLARRRSGRAKPTRPCLAVRASRMCSWRSTPETAPSSGPRARAALARRSASGIATDPRGNSYVTGISRHGDVRSGRSQRDRAQAAGVTVTCSWRSTPGRHPAVGHERGRRRRDRAPASRRTAAATAT